MSSHTGVGNSDLFRLLVEQVKDYAIFLLDPDGRVASWNSGAELLKGYRSGDIIGEHIIRFYTDEDRGAGQPTRLLQVALTKGRVEDQGWRVRKDGSRFWADVVITALYDNNGVHRGYAKVTRDLTQHKLMVEELERQGDDRTKALELLNVQLHEMNQKLEAFCDIVVGRQLRMLELEKKEVEQLRDEIMNLRRTK